MVYMNRMNPLRPGLGIGGHGPYGDGYAPAPGYPPAPGYVPAPYAPAPGGYGYAPAPYGYVPAPAPYGYVPAPAPYGYGYAPAPDIGGYAPGFNNNVNGNYYARPNLAQGFMAALTSGAGFEAGQFIANDFFGSGGGDYGSFF